MIERLTAIVCGALFGAGLALSDMANPDRVIAFLDIFGAWDPTLAFVMAGALVPMALAWRVQRGMDNPFATAHFAVPKTSPVDIRLCSGAVVFGVGWGLTGFCPGPAVAALPLDGWQPAIFIAAMLAGMFVYKLIADRL
jgi:uncharacterized membrane protein YedE/YeeE